MSHNSPLEQPNSLRASSPIWASETSLARTRVLAKLASLAQIGELARRLATRRELDPKCASQLFLGWLVGTHQSFLPLSLETVPEDFAKVNSAQYCSRDEWINKGGLAYFLLDYSVCLYTLYLSSSGSECASTKTRSVCWSIK